MSARGGPTRVLHVDDDVEFASMSASFLERESDELTVETEAAAADALDRLADGSFDCVVSDYQMPGMSGLELLRTVRDDHPELPFILFTGKGSEEIASEAVSAGVTDYLQKEPGTDQYAILANRIENAVERYRAKSELERREESLARAQRIASLGNWDWDVETGELHWSDQIYRIFGVDPEEFEETYEAFLGFVHPEDRLEVEAAVDEALSGATDYDVDHRIVRPDGTIRVVRERGEVTFEDGDPVFMTGTVYDITERQRQASRFQALIEHGSDVVAVVTADGVADYVSLSIERVLGYEPDDVVGETILEFVHEDDRPPVREALSRTLSDADEVVTAEFRFRSDGGGWRVLETVASNRLEDPAVEGIVVNARDVTERKRRERKLRESRRTYRQLFNSIDDVVLVHDFDGDLRALNRSGLDRLGYHADDIADVSMSDIHPGDDAEIDRSEIEALLGDAPVTFESTLVTSEGESIPVEVSATTMDYYGEQTVLAVARDVTARNAREEELEQTTEELAVLNRMVRHDIRNDVTVALGWLDLVDDHVDDEGREALERARKAGRHVIELTEAVRDFLRVVVDEEEADLDAVDLERVLTDEVARRRELYPEASFTVDVPSVSVAANGMLSSVFVNLLNNAVQHNDADDPEVSVTAEVREEVLRVRIADNGPGIPREQRSDVFGREDRKLDGGGTGIGLYLVDSLVSQYGGDVWIEDNDPRGAVLVVELNRADGVDGG